MGTIWAAVAETIDFTVVLSGGASRDRTDGLVIANDALSQLSYSPTVGKDVMQFYQPRGVETKRGGGACGVAVAIIKR